MPKTIKCKDKIVVLNDDELNEIRCVNFKDDITKKYTHLEIMTGKGYHQFPMIPINEKIDVQTIFDFLKSNREHFDLY